MSLGIYTAIALAMHQPFHEGARDLRFFDLRIYRGAAERIVHGGLLYRTPILDRLGFTYPPFAALLLTPLAFAPLPVDELTVTALNVLLLVWTLRRTLMIPSNTRSSATQQSSTDRAATWSRAALIAAGAIWLEPVSVTLGYGQIDLLITALVVFDLSRPDTARTKGAALGIAAAIKLTPLLFLPYLLLSRRRRAATIGTGTFALSIAISYATITQDASRYWQHLVLDISRIGNVADTGNQSLQGAIARLDPVAHPSTAEHLVVAAIAVLGLALAVRASRSGKEEAGFSLTALTALLVSPISWTHHWTLAMPGLLLLCRRAHQQRARPLTLAAMALILLGYSYLPEYTEGPLQHAGINTILYADPYTLAATIVLGVAAIRTISAIGNPDRDRRYPRERHTPNGSRVRATG